MVNRHLVQFEIWQLLQHTLTLHWPGLLEALARTCLCVMYLVLVRRRSMPQGVFSLVWAGLQHSPAKAILLQVGWWGVGFGVGVGGEK